MAKFDSSKQPNFDSAKAAKGRKPFVNPTDEKPASPRPPVSTQERGAGTGVRVVKPDVSGTATPNRFRDGLTGPRDRYTDTNRRTSNQAEYNENTELHTDRAKDPLNSYIRKVLPAVQNPDAGNNRSYSRKAAGRVVGTGKRRVL